MLLPALSKVRDHARYARWKALSHNLQSDPDVCVYYTMENDRGNNTLTNMAMSSQAQTDPALLNAPIGGYFGAWEQAPQPSPYLTRYWAHDGRFYGKPSLTFTPGDDDVVFLPSQVEMVANLLNTTQQVSVAVWIAGATPYGRLGVQLADPQLLWVVVSGYFILGSLQRREHLLGCGHDQRQCRPDFLPAAQSGDEMAVLGLYQELRAEGNDADL